MAIRIKKSVFKLDTVLHFGQYKGSTVEDVIHSDPQYLIWALSKMDWFELDKDSKDALDFEDEGESRDEGRNSIASRYDDEDELPF